MRRSPGRPKQKEREESTAQQILQVASRMFMELGYEGVALERVASEAGVTKATVYYYFSNKATLFTESVIAMMIFIQSIVKQLLDEEGTLHQRLHKIVEMHLSNTVVDAQGVMSKAEHFLSVDQMQAIRRAEEGIYVVLAREFEAAQEQLQMREVNPMFAARAFGALMMMGNMKNAEGNPYFPSPAQAAQQIVDLFMSGVFLGEQQKPQ